MCDDVTVMYRHIMCIIVDKLAYQPLFEVNGLTKPKGLESNLCQWNVIILHLVV